MIISLVPHRGFEPRFLEPKSNVLPLDERGMGGDRGIKPLSSLALERSFTELIVAFGRSSRSRTYIIRI